MADKTCNRCRESKPPSEFYPRRYAPGKVCLNSICKPCSKEVACEWTTKNKERHNRNTSRWVKANPKKHSQSVAAWETKNKESRTEYNVEWRRNNRPLLNAKTARRRATQVNATPAWRNEFFIREAYELARLRTKMLGFSWHVDHIVPINSPIVCGLHVEHNLQVIPGNRNMSKANRHWPDMP